MRLLLLALAAALFAACGLPDDMKLSELTTDEIKELCQEVENERVSCSEDIVVTRSTELCEDRKFKADCDGTVGNWRACNESNPCDFQNVDCGKAASCQE